MTKAHMSLKNVWSLIGRRHGRLPRRSRKSLKRDPAPLRRHHLQRRAAR
ncbi:hypothetical protein ACRAWD_15395 [Caulobacter segnis]